MYTGQNMEALECMFYIRLIFLYPGEEDQCEDRILVQSTNKTNIKNLSLLKKKKITSPSNSKTKRNTP